MKPKYLIPIIVLAWFSVLAQTNVTTPSVPGVKGEATSLLLGVIPLIVPILVALIKSALKFVPTWSLPIIAAGLGEALNFTSGLAGGPSTTVLNGVILGAAGTGLREVIDQLKNRTVPEVA